MWRMYFYKSCKNNIIKELEIFWCLTFTQQVLRKYAYCTDFWSLRVGVKVPKESQRTFCFITDQVPNPSFSLSTPLLKAELI